jgi:hypothetical protein
MGLKCCLPTVIAISTGIALGGFRSYAADSDRDPQLASDAGPKPPPSAAPKRPPLRKRLNAFSPTGSHARTARARFISRGRVVCSRERRRRTAARERALRSKPSASARSPCGLSALTGSDWTARTSQVQRQELRRSPPKPTP